MSTPAFQELYATYRRPILALCYQITGNRADAEDAFQDTFLGVARGLPAFRGDAAIFTWVYRIAIRCALRTRSRNDVSADGSTANAATTEQPPSLRDVSRAIAGLSAPHRIVLGLFALEGLSHDQIAEILGIPVGTVWSRLHVARKQLAEALQDAPLEGSSRAVGVAGTPVPDAARPG